MVNETKTQKKKQEVTIKEVAALAKVSPATVGRVIGNYGSVSEKTRSKVMQAIRELNYHPNGIAQSMKVKHTHTIGLIISNILNPFYSSIVRAVEDIAVKYNYHIIICNSDENIDKELSYVKTLLEKRVDGLLISTSYKEGTKTGKKLKNLYKSDLPIVLIDRKIEGLDLPAILVDNFGGAYEGISHLIKLGHKKIGIIMGLPYLTTISQRIEGYKKALIDHDINFDPDLIGDGGNVQVSGGIKATKQLLSNSKKRPTALFAFNNLLTTGALMVIRKLGLTIPEEVAMVGWDDFELASVLQPPLTVVTQPTYIIGSMAAEKLINMISKGKIDNYNQNDVIILKPNLIVREGGLEDAHNDPN